MKKILFLLLAFCSFVAFAAGELNMDEVNKYVSEKLNRDKEITITYKINNEVKEIKLPQSSSGGGSSKRYDTFTLGDKLVPEKINETLHLNGGPYSVELYSPVDTTIPELNSSFRSEGYIVINGSEQEIYMYHTKFTSEQDLKFKYTKENKTLKVESGYNITSFYMLEVKYI